MERVVMKPENIWVKENGKWIAPGTYVEWLESFGAPITSLSFYSSLSVYIVTINPFEDIYRFSLRGDDCTLVGYEYSTRTRKLVCTCPFIDDDDDWDISVEAFNARLAEFCEKYKLTPKFRK